MSYQVHNSRRIPPRAPPRKRKERDDDELGCFKPSAAAATTVVKPPRWKTMQPGVSSNQLLAGYMAYEFITRGTLLGQDWCSALPVEPRWEAGAEPVNEREAGSGGGAVQDSYAEVASILKTEGAHIPGIVNPTQLARWIQM